MGDEGARYSDDVGEFAEEVVAILDDLGEVAWRKMFGGAGIFIEGSMFALVDAGGRLHLKVDESNVDRFTARGSDKHSRMPYYTVPVEVLEDDDELRSWARVSADIARS